MGDQAGGHGGPASHPSPTSAFSPTGGRLNLLLSYPAWQPAGWVHCLPRLLEPQGVSAHVAPSARHAEKLIRQTPVHIAVIDLRVPLDERPAGSADGAPPEDGGPRILELLSRLESPPPTVVLRSPRTQRDDSRHLSAALRCGAFAVVDRTAADLEMMLKVMQRVLARFYQDRWPGANPVRFV